MKEIVYGEVKQPQHDCTNQPIMLSDETMQTRYAKVLERMKNADFTTLVIYADLEHGSNFEYLTGFLPRFEEAILVLQQTGENYMLMGNENLNKVASARLNATPIHVPHFSLPNQPMETQDTIVSLLKKAGIKSGAKLGLVGWKNFTSKSERNQTLFDIPHYIVNALQEIVGNSGDLVNATYLLIGEDGARCTNTVNEIEHYEFGASLASDCMLNAMNKLDVGISELQLGTELNALGQRNSVVTIAATGKRFEKANLYPTDRTIQKGDTISLTVGYKGGLSSRAGYAVEDDYDLPIETRDYLDVVVKPYYQAVITWLEQVHCGSLGKDVYQQINEVLPKAQYHWELCPGHLTADEEWMSSPIYEGSEEVLQSGMLFQIDIIPSVKGYQGVSAESTVVLANEQLRRDLEKQSPSLWKRIQNRRAYIKEELGIDVHPDILPMCSTVAYLRPYLLNKKNAMKKIR